MDACVVRLTNEFYRLRYRYRTELEIQNILAEKRRKARGNRLMTVRFEPYQIPTCDQNLMIADTEHRKLCPIRERFVVEREETWKWNTMEFDQMLGS